MEETETPAVVLVWESLGRENGETKRAKVPGGWLVSVETQSGVGLTFVSDPGHYWTKAAQDGVNARVR